MRRRAAAVLLAGALALPAGRARAQGAPDVVESHRVIMGTAVGLRAYAPTDDDAARARAAFEPAFAELARVDQLMSHWRDDSDVGRLNAAAGTPAQVAVDPLTFEVLTAARRFSRLSGGAFDVTVGAFQGLWRFDHDSDGTIPSPPQVAARLGLVGWRELELFPSRHAARLRRAGMRVTLGGIAKGYAVDRAVAALRRAGLRDFIVQAGGDLFASGSHGGRPWSVGIQDPRGDQPFAAATVRDRTFSTSGDYERFVVVDGVRYHHILDPKTGYPARACRSVTIAASSGTLAEGLSKAVFILGVARGLPLVRRLGADAVVVDGAGHLHVTPGLRRSLQLLRPLTPETP